MVGVRFTILLATALAPVFAFWRMECRGVAGYYRIDPLVTPGGPSPHLHAILGSGGFSESATYSDITGSNCTSCLVTQDKSSYWHPALYFLDSTTNQFELVEQVGGTLAYYLLNTGNGNTNITAFPQGFRMIAGDQMRREFTVGNVEMVDPPKSNWAGLNQTTQDALSQRALGFNCLDYSTTPEASLYRHFFPDKNYLDANCPDGIRFELMFPSCWNGKDVDSPDHRSHVAYPDLVMAGDCPADFPVRLPSLFYETIWNTPAYKGRTGQFVISNGDVSGFAYHGDFMMGWDEGFLQQAVNTCTNPSGLIEDCPLFNIQSLDAANSCKINPPANLAGDNVNGPAPSLPGNVALFGTFMNAAMIPTYNPAISGQADATIGLEGGYGAGSVVSAAGTPAVNNPAAAPTPSSAPPASVPAPAPASSSPTTVVNIVDPTPAAADNSAFSTEYITAGNVVTEILWEQTTVYITEAETTSWTTTTVAPTPAVLKARHVHNHMRRHQQMHRHGHAK